jgi:hypothetical protein
VTHSLFYRSIRITKTNGQLIVVSITHETLKGESEMKSLKTQLITLLNLVVLGLMLTLVSPNTAHAQDPGVTAFQDDEHMFSFSPVANYQLQFQIPKGKRLVIERLTAYIRVPHNVKVNGIILGTHVNNSPAGHQLPKPVLEFSTPGGDDQYSLFVAPNLYADGGESVDFLVTLSVPCNANVGATISGHLVCPQNFNCVSSLPGSVSGVDDKAPATTRATDTNAVAQTRPRFAKLPKGETVAVLKAQ